MRFVLATLFALYVAVVAAMPHGHGGAAAHDRHECVACCTAGAEPCDAPAIDGAPRALLGEPLAPEPVSAPPRGAPLGAVPGQSPPAA